MPQKRITWIGFLVILGVGILSSWSLFQSRTKFLPTGVRFQLATIGAFAAPVIAVIALYLWYYINEKQ